MWFRLSLVKLTKGLKFMYWYAKSKLCFCWLTTWISLSEHYWCFSTVCWPTALCVLGKPPWRVFWVMAFVSLDECMAFTNAEFCVHKVPSLNWKWKSKTDLWPCYGYWQLFKFQAVQGGVAFCFMGYLWGYRNGLFCICIKNCKKRLKSTTHFNKIENQQRCLASK